MMLLRMVVQYRLIMVRRLRKIENYSAEQTPGQIQLERFEKYGQVRGDFTVVENGEKCRLINVFQHLLIEKKLKEF